MKIAVWHNLPSGGGKRALYHHVAGLLARGHAVEAWCPETADRSFLPLSELITEHVLPVTFKKRRRNLISERFSGFTEIVDRASAMDEPARQAAQFINNGGFDLLFANSCRCFRVPFKIGHYTKIPKALYLQEPYRNLYESLPSLPWAALPSRKQLGVSRWKYFKHFVRDLIEVQGLRIQVREELENAKCFDSILVNSFFSRESVLRAYGINARVCYLGVDTDMYKPIAQNKGNYLVGIGGVDIGKGIERVISAIAQVSESIRPECIWIGNFTNKRHQQKLQNLAESKKVKISFEINLPDARVITLLSRAMALIYTPRLEPFGLAPLEANACGTPVIAIAEGGVRETVHDGINGILVTNDDPNELAQAITTFAQNPDDAKTLGLRARQYVVENWTWDKAIDRLENCFEQVIASGRKIESDGKQEN